MRVAMGEPISAVNPISIRRTTGRSDPGASRVVIAAVTRSMVRELVCRAICAAFPAVPQRKEAGTAVVEPFPALAEATARDKRACAISARSRPVCRRPPTTR